MNQLITTKSQELVTKDYSIKCETRPRQEKMLLKSNDKFVERQEWKVGNSVFKNYFVNYKVFIFLKEIS